MRYRIQFASDTVGQSRLPSFEVDTPEHLGVASRTADLQRLIRQRVVDALTAAPAPGAATARGVIEGATDIVVMLNAGEGAAYYGTANLGRFNIYPVP